MAMATQNDLVNARANADQWFSIQKASIANQAAGNLVSLWRSTGPLPAQGAIPGAAATVDKTATGAFNFNNPASGSSWIDQVSLNCSIAGRFVFYDRLIHNGNLSGTVTTAQTVNTPAIPRGATTGNDVEWYLECYTDLGATGVTATITYTNQAGTSGRTTTVTIPATWRASRLLPIVPASGDTGIQSIQSVTLSATTGTAGAFGVTCMRKLGRGFPVPVGNSSGIERQGLFLQVPNNACIGLVMETSTTSTGLLTGEFNLIQG